MDKNKEKHHVVPTDELISDMTSLRIYGGSGSIDPQDVILNGYCGTAKCADCACLKSYQKCSITS